MAAHQLKTVRNSPHTKTRCAETSHIKGNCLKVECDSKAENFAVANDAGDAFMLGTNDSVEHSQIL